MFISNLTNAKKHKKGSSICNPYLTKYKKINIIKWLCKVEMKE